MCVSTASLGTMIDGNLETLLPIALPVVGSGMGVIVHHLVGVSSDMEEVETLTSAVAGQLFRTLTQSDTWGGATIVDEVEASVMDVLEETVVHTWGEEMAIEITSNIFAAGVPSSTTSNCCIASACNKSTRLCI